MRIPEDFVPHPLDSPGADDKQAGPGVTDAGLRGLVHGVKAGRMADTPLPLPRRLPPSVAALLAQVADTPLARLAVGPSGHFPPPDTGASAGFSYAASVILPQTGWNEAEFLPRLVNELSKPGNLSVLDREMNRRVEGAPVPYSLSLRAEGGAAVELLVTPRPIGPTPPEGDGPQLCASLAAVPLAGDASAPAWTERTRLLNLLDRLPAFVVLMGPDYSIRYENRGFRQLFGPGVGRPCYEVIRGRDRPCALCQPFDVFDSRTLCVYEWASPERRSSFRVYSYPFEDLDGSLLVLKLGIDITSGVRAQEALSISEERYRSITDNLALGIAVLDRALGITASNPRLREWFGASASPGGLLCHMLAEHCGEDNARCSGCASLATFRDGRIHERRLEATIGKGGRRSFRLTACPILGADGGVVSVIAMLEDETDRLRVEERLQRARKLEAMGTLATGIAHEINQPLSALQLYAGSLEMLAEKDRAPDRETLLARLSLILGEAARIRDIIDHMRALVAHGGASLVPTRVDAAVERALGLVGAQLQAHRVALELDIPPDLPAVRANPVQLEQVVINLVVNAMHALDTVPGPDRRIRIEAMHRPRAEQPDARSGGATPPERAEPPAHADRPERQDAGRVTRQAPDGAEGQAGERAATGPQPVKGGGQVLLAVSDNGPGLQGLEDRVFDPFFTTKDPHKGLGLGLAIVHSFVESWGGEISVGGCAAPLGGAAFTLSLHEVAEPAGARVDGGGDADGNLG